MTAFPTALLDGYRLFRDNRYAQENERYRKLAETAAMSLSLLKFVGQASLVDEAMLPS